MKTLILVALTLTSLPAFASQLSCETTVAISVAQLIHTDPKSSEVVKSVTVQPSVFSTIGIYSVISSAPEVEGISGIPSSTQWAVFTRQGPQGTCTVEQILTDIHAE